MWDQHSLRGIKVVLINLIYDWLDLQAVLLRARMISLNLLVNLFQGLHLAGNPERALLNVTFR